MRGGEEREGVELKVSTALSNRPPDPDPTTRGRFRHGGMGMIMPMALVLALALAGGDRRVVGIPFAALMY